MTITGCNRDGRRKELCLVRVVVVVGNRYATLKPKHRYVYAEFVLLLISRTEPASFRLRSSLRIVKKCEHIHQGVGDRHIRDKVGAANKDATLTPKCRFVYAISGS